jgi:vancomycin resistance protein YoaR
VRTSQKAVLVALGLPILFVLLVGVAWALDVRASEGEVVRNVSLAGTPVGGLSASQLGPVLAALDDDYRTTAVRVRTPEGDFTLQAGEVGLAVDRQATIAAAMQIGRRGAYTSRAAEWFRSVIAPRRAPVEITVTAAQVRALTAERDPTRTLPVVEPSIALRDGEFVAVEGEPGRGVDPADVLQSLAEEARAGELPLEIDVAPSDIPPRLSVADAERLIGRAESLVAGDFKVAAADVATVVPRETLRRWIGSRATDGGLELTFDAEQAQHDLTELLSDVGQAPVDARLTLENGAVQVIPGRNGTACCADRAGALAVNALVTRRDTTLELPLRSVEPRLTAERARQLGVRERVSTFTTDFAAGRPRVQNIHLIADLVRGQTLQPGETFSVNDHVGRRTREKGFVEDGVIENGVMSTDVGGGISQFATTMFNAAFFAGLEFEEYQAHSIYFSRYPYGREATLSFPRPDLKIRNNTPHGIMFWTSHTPTSVTVEVWSTPWVTVEQSDQRTSSVGACTRVTTERTRTLLTDGSKRVDQVYAVYRPAEGVACG